MKRNRALEIWGLIWGSPIHLVGGLYVLLLWATRGINFARADFPFVDFVVIEKNWFAYFWRRYAGSNSLLKKWLRGWAGSNIGMFTIYRWDCLDREDIIGHERKHAYQSFMFGPFHPVFYLLSSMWEGYGGNILEEDAQDQPLEKNHDE